jgi:hypothetical protein
MLEGHEGFCKKVQDADGVTPQTIGAPSCYVRPLHNVVPESGGTTTLVAQQIPFLHVGLRR